MKTLKTRTIPMISLTYDSEPDVEMMNPMELKRTQVWYFWQSMNAARRSNRKLTELIRISNSIANRLMDIGGSASRS